MRGRNGTTDTRSSARTVGALGNVVQDRAGSVAHLVGLEQRSDEGVRGVVTESCRFGLGRGVLSRGGFHWRSRSHSNGSWSGPRSSRPTRRSVRLEWFASRKGSGKGAEVQVQ